MTTPDSPDASRPDADGPPRTPLADDRAALDRRDAVEVIRSEERLDVSTVVRASGRAVLRRYVVTETVTQTFEVRHEEFRVDHEPFVDGQRADGVDLVDERAFGDRFVETVLHREVPVVTMQVVAAERVRVYVDTVTDQVRVSEDVARERVDVDVPDHVETSGGA
jgi:stress response protein YsnF